MAAGDSNGQAAQAQQGTPYACDLSLDEHIDVAMTALTMFGLGFGCETEYRAMCVILETARVLNGHRDFDPREEAEKLIEAARAAYAKAASQRAEMEQAALEAMTAGGPVQ